MLVIGVLATWRAASLFAREEGPYNVFVKLRHLLGVRYDEYSSPYGTTMPSKMIICVWCNSLWIGFVVSIAIDPSSFLSYTVVPFALSGGAIFIEELREWIGQA